MTSVYKMDPKHLNMEVLHLIAEALKNGAVIIYPTDTIYGIGGNALQSSVVLRIFEVKKRPLELPVPVVVNSILMANDLAHVTDDAKKLMKAFWPGPLTIILKRKSIVPDEVTGGSSKVGIRIPNHLIPIKLMELTKFPLVATSANLHGQPGPIQIDEQLKKLGGNIDLIINTEETLRGVPSTVLDLTTKPLKLLRQGQISRNEIESVMTNNESRILFN
jgi:L-threonylcarbamoyladenylate synthase